VSVFGGFVFSDSAKNGLAVVVTARHDLAAARTLAKEIAERAWADRTRFRKQLTPLDEAISLALKQDRQPIILSDAGDNPGGGGTGRTTELLAALVRADAKDVLIGSFYDVALARAAHAAGKGAKIRARFNGDPGLPCDVPFEADAEVVGLHDGDIVGRLGIFQGKRLRLGPSAALRIGGTTVVVISDRSQTADPTSRADISAPASGHGSRRSGSTRSTPRA
jgi:microcystin degradation protein MlrC